jgi:hypothetical protein
MIDEMKGLSLQMQNLTGEFNTNPGEVFVEDPSLTILADPPGGGGGYPKFSADDPLQKRWLAISTQLAKMIANPHLTQNEIKTVFNGIGMLGVLYIEKFKLDNVVDQVV